MNLTKPLKKCRTDNQELYHESQCLRFPSSLPNNRKLPHGRPPTERPPPSSPQDPNREKTRESHTRSCSCSIYQYKCDHDVAEKRIISGHRSTSIWSPTAAPHLQEPDPQTSHSSGTLKKLDGHEQLHHPNSKIHQTPSFPQTSGCYKLSKMLEWELKTSCRIFHDSIS